MNIAELFDAEIEIDGPDPDAEGTFFVKRREDVGHDQFMVGLLTFLGDRDRLVMHHRSGFALVVLPYARAQRLQSYPWVQIVAGVQFDPERFAEVTGLQQPS